MAAVCEDEPFIPGEREGFLLAEGGLIAAELLVVDILGNNDIVSLNIVDNVGLREAARLYAEIGVGAGDAGCGVCALKGERSVGDSALCI
ncbi:hypothetical protein SDC9_203652 [bioreactor metagenome]|uniref:Uncharacterized protein n=1 Tax=bioreactor metagenome TaxID=1076179 RepID=A0A645IX32_9ZZZZ